MGLTTFHCNFSSSLPKEMCSRYIKRSRIRSIVCTVLFLKANHSVSEIDTILETSLFGQIMFDLVNLSGTGV